MLQQLGMGFLQSLSALIPAEPAMNRESSEPTLFTCAPEVWASLLLYWWSVPILSSRDTACHAAIARAGD